jgi:uncharacterized LabA/DUF88 family protein
MRAVLLLDADNVPLEDVSLNTILVCWLAGQSPDGVGDATVRVYGGWWNGNVMSDARHKAALWMAEACPALLNIAQTYWRVRFEFADALISPALSNQGELPIRSTFVLRPAPPLTATQRPGQGCDESDCEVKAVRKWIYRRRGCTRNKCPKKFGDVWLRAEQKQVDTHLAVDLLLVAQGKQYDRIALATDDIDLLPALAAAFRECGGSKNVAHIRFRAESSYLDGRLLDMGGAIFTLPPQG